MGFSTKSSRKPHKTQVVKLLDEGMCCPFKSENDRANSTLECIWLSNPPSLLDMPALQETTVRAIPRGDGWVEMGKHLTRLHVVPRNTAYTPQLEDGGPELSTLVGPRITFKSYLNGNRHHYR